MKIFKFITFLLLAAFVSACSQQQSVSKQNEKISFGLYDIKGGKAEDQTASVNTENLGGGGGGGREERAPVAQQLSLNQAEQSQTAPIVAERKIIRDADLQLESDSPEEAQRKITQIAESASGFVVESSQSASDVKVSARDVVTMTVRVPAAKFDETIAAIRQTGTRTISETVKGQDVTEEFIDIEARLKTQKALEQQFVEIMKQAKTVEDALSVQSQLADVRGEIEKVEGRRRFLENQSSLSTLKIRLQTPTAIGASSNGFFYRLTESLSDGFNFALNFLLGLITFVIAILPFLLLIVLPIYLLLRYFLRKSRKRKSASEILKDEINQEL